MFISVLDIELIDFFMAEDSYRNRLNKANNESLQVLSNEKINSIYMSPKSSILPKCLPP